MRRRKHAKPFVMILEPGPTIRTENLPEMAGAIFHHDDRRVWLPGKRSYTIFHESRFPIRSIKTEPRRFLLVDRDRDDPPHLECGPKIVYEEVAASKQQLEYRWGSSTTRVRAKTRFKLATDFGKAENAKPAQRGQRDRIILALVAGCFVGLGLALTKFIIVNWPTVQALGRGGQS